MPLSPLALPKILFSTLIVIVIIILLLRIQLSSSDSNFQHVAPQQLQHQNYRRSVPIPQDMDSMLTAGRNVYDKQATPTQNAGIATNVKLAMYIEGIGSFQTHTMDFQLDVYLQQFWKDPRLAHNESSRILIRDNNILDRIWHPDVYFANARIAQFHQVTQPNFLLWIESDGSILYDTRVSMVVICAMNLKNFPLDSQWCHLRILSYAYDINQLQIEWVEHEPITKNMNITMSDMDIVKLVPGSCNGNYSTGVWSCVTAEFFVARELTHHIMQTYVPTTLIVVISWFSFWLDVEAVPARVSLAITTLLTLSTQANSVKNSLPEVSYMKSLDLFLAVSVLFVFGVLIEFTIVNYTQRNATMAAAGLLDESEGTTICDRVVRWAWNNFLKWFCMAQKEEMALSGNIGENLPPWRRLFFRKLRMPYKTPNHEKAAKCCGRGKRKNKEQNNSNADIEAGSALLDEKRNSNVDGSWQRIFAMERSSTIGGNCCAQLQHVTSNDSAGNCGAIAPLAPVIVCGDEHDNGIGEERIGKAENAKEQQKIQQQQNLVNQREAARLANWSRPELSYCEGLAMKLSETAAADGITTMGQDEPKEYSANLPKSTSETGTTQITASEYARSGSGIADQGNFCQLPEPALSSAKSECCSPVPIKGTMPIPSFISSSQEQLNCRRSCRKNEVALLLGCPPNSGRLSRRASAMTLLLDPIDIGTGGSRHDSMASIGGNGGSCKGGQMSVQAKWRHAVRKLQMNKREAGRIQAKKIDSWSRWMFPVSYFSFQAAYWYYYLRLAA